MFIMLQNSNLLCPKLCVFVLNSMVIVHCILPHVKLKGTELSFPVLIICCYHVFCENTRLLNWIKNLSRAHTKQSQYIQMCQILWKKCAAPKMFIMLFWYYAYVFTSPLIMLKIMLKTETLFFMDTAVPVVKLNC